VTEKLASNRLYKSFSSGQISWSNFNKRDSIDSEYDAGIKTFIGYRINEVYNFTSATAIARMDLEKSFYTSQSNKLLEHENYHFKITELVTRRLNKVLDKHHFAQPTKTEEIINRYIDTLYFMQKAYDRETNHNLNRDKQEEWKFKIDNELKTD